jgi:hypothetical protein
MKMVPPPFLLIRVSVSLQAAGHTTYDVQLSLSLSSTCPRLSARRSATSIIIVDSLIVAVFIVVVVVVVDDFVVVAVVVAVSMYN